MKLLQLTDNQILVFERTGKISEDKLFYDASTDFLYISLRDKVNNNQYFSNSIEIKSGITVFYEKQDLYEEIHNLAYRLFNWNISQTNNSEFLGNTTKRYNGIQIKHVSKLININQWKLPYIELHEFPYIENDKKSTYIIINFLEEDPFNYTEEEYEKINDDIGLLWSQNGKLKQLTFKTD